ncbi:MAG: sigma-70 family RNA polymerase sigma factor [Myxococcota bacterium]|nr:sigma-70 family RNA polymerase sigma factor [Myxococcota bacterium]
MSRALEVAIRECGGRILSALAARFRDVDVAEDAFASACLKAVEHSECVPEDMAAWLYRVAERSAFDARRRAKVREHATLPEGAVSLTVEDMVVSDARLIPDERLRLIFVCCHPAIAPEARAPLALRVVLGLSTQEIARAFMLSEVTIAQRLVRAKRKIAEAGIPFEVPGRHAWDQRLDAVLSSLEVAYAKAHEDAGGAGPHATFADEMLRLTGLLSELLPFEPDVLALAATVRYAEARRPARVDEAGRMVPLTDQDPTRWSHGLIGEAEAYLKRAARLERPSPRELEAAIHGAWCARASLAEPPPWSVVLGLYDMLAVFRGDPVVRINRAVAVAEVIGAEPALAEIDALDRAEVNGFVPYYVVRADLLRRLGRTAEARAAYAKALELGVPRAERLWIEDRLATLP